MEADPTGSTTFASFAEGALAVLATQDASSLTLWTLWTAAPAKSKKHGRGRAGARVFLFRAFLKFSGSWVSWDVFLHAWSLLGSSLSLTQHTPARSLRPRLPGCLVSPQFFSWNAPTVVSPQVPAELLRQQRRLPVLTIRNMQRSASPLRSFSMHPSIS